MEDRHGWPGKDAPAHASVVHGYNLQKHEVIFSESWGEPTRGRRMRAEELEGTSYYAVYFTRYNGVQPGGAAAPQMPRQRRTRSESTVLLTLQLPLGAWGPGSASVIYWPCASATPAADDRHPPTSIGDVASGPPTLLTVYRAATGHPYP
jgi:hypothetical protein